MTNQKKVTVAATPTPTPAPPPLQVGMPFFLECGRVIILPWSGAQTALQTKAAA